MVNLAATGVEAGAGERRMTWRIATGIAVSLAVHALLLSSWRGGGRPADAPPAPPRPLSIRVQAPPPPPRVETPAPPPPPLAAGRPARAPAPRKPRPVIAVPPDTAAPAAPDPFVVEQAPEAPPPTDTPRFDLDAARRTARTLANIRDPAREGTAVAQFPEKPLETESRAARAIGAAKRRNCKDGVPGGLLAPLLLLADKKDSGCKW